MLIYINKLRFFFCFCLALTASETFLIRFFVNLAALENPGAIRNRPSSPLDGRFFTKWQ